MLTQILAAAVLSLTPLQDPDCARPGDCRTFAFTLKTGGESETYRRGEPLPWVTPNGRLFIVPGESVEIRLDEQGAISVVSSQPASDVLTPSIAANLVATFLPGGVGEGATERDVIPLSNMEKPVPPSPGTLRVSFIQAPGREDMILVIQSGLEARVRYDAAMMVAGQEGLGWAQTSVCRVMPSLLAFEHWPFPIYALHLGGFRLEPDAPAREMVCE